MDKIICVGKNYLDHARELGDAIPEKPVLFLKPPSAAIQVQCHGDTIQVPLPAGRGSVHHECEIVARIGGDGRIEAVTLGLDMTLRELQTQLKKNGHPWEISKVFPGSAILGPWIPLADFPDFQDVAFRFTLDGELRQQGSAREMSLSPEECLAHARDYFPTCSGDLLFTGTPAGVGPVRAGQTGELRWGDRLRFGVRWIA